jgi:hypothetical protein
MRWAALLLVIISLVGCGKSRGRERNPTENRLYKIGKAYNAANFDEKLPNNFADIKPYLEGDIPEDLEVSPNDGANFVILWNVDFRTLPRDPKNPRIVQGYEKNGKDGKRFVLLHPIGILSMTEEEFDKAAFPPGRKRE